MTILAVERVMSVPIVDVSALVEELGIPPADVDEGFDTVELSEEATKAVEALHAVCRGGAGGLIAVNHACPVEKVLAASAAFHAQDRAVKDTYAAANIYDGYASVSTGTKHPRWRLCLCCHNLTVRCRSR